MIVTIHQPEHFPWLGLINKIAKADIYVVMDDVQYKKNNFQNRNKIYGRNKDNFKWLTVPVVLKGHMDSTIKDIEIADTVDWRTRNLNMIEDSYKNHPYFNQHFPWIKEILSKNYTKLSELNNDITFKILDLLDIHPKIVYQSKMETHGEKSDLVLDICERLNADVYISGPGGREYMNLDKFKDAGIDVVFNDYVHPVYNQINNGEFIPYLSIIDMMMNNDIETCKKIIKEG